MGPVQQVRNPEGVVVQEWGLVGWQDQVSVHLQEDAAQDEHSQAHLEGPLEGATRQVLSLIHI